MNLVLSVDGFISLLDKTGDLLEEEWSEEAVREFHKEILKVSYSFRKMADSGVEVLQVVLTEDQSREAIELFGESL